MQALGLSPLSMCTIFVVCIVKYLLLQEEEKRETGPGIPCIRYILFKLLERDRERELRRVLPPDSVMPKVIQSFNFCPFLLPFVFYFLMASPRADHV